MTHCLSGEKPDNLVQTTESISLSRKASLSATAPDTTFFEMASRVLSPEASAINDLVSSSGQKMTLNTITNSENPQGHKRVLIYEKNEAISLNDPQPIKLAIIKVSRKRRTVKEIKPRKLSVRTRRMLQQTYGEPIRSSQTHTKFSKQIRNKKSRNCI